MFLMHLFFNWLNYQRLLTDRLWYQCFWMGDILNFIEIIYKSKKLSPLASLNLYHGEKKKNPPIPRKQTDKQTENLIVFLSDRWMVGRFRVVDSNTSKFLFVLLETFSYCRIEDVHITVHTAARTIRVRTGPQYTLLIS